MKMAKCCNSSSSRIVQYLPYLFLQRISAYELVKSDEGKKKKVMAWHSGLTMTCCETLISILVHFFLWPFTLVTATLRIPRLLL